jgi:hypothetical protein
VAYVPLNLVTDDTGGGKAAFSARMLYWPGDENTWGAAQPMRVLWVVEALADYCEEEGFEPTVDEEEDPEQYDEEFDAWCEEHRSQDELQVVQTYPESWHLTGLAVREDHGLDVAIAYENPAKPEYTDEDLWELSWGLGQSFIPQRDCEITSTLHTDPNPGTCHVDGLRDLTVYQYDRDGIQIGNETIAQVFDAESPIKNSVTITERLGLAADALRVENFRYPTEDYMSYLAMTETPRILAKFPTAVAPSLLFAREEHYRSAGLEAISGTGKDVLTLQVGADVYKPKTLTGMSWAPFHYNPNTGEDGEVIGWETYPIEDYVYRLDDDLRALFISLYPDDTSETTDGRVVTAESYYLAMLNGIENDVPLSGCPAGEEECPFPSEEGESYETIIVASEKFTSRFSHVTTEVAGEIYEAYHSEWVMYIDQSGGRSMPSAPSPGSPVVRVSSMPWASPCTSSSSRRSIRCSGRARLRRGCLARCWRPLP